MSSLDSFFPPQQATPQFMLDNGRRNSKPELRPGLTPIFKRRVIQTVIFLVVLPLALIGSGALLVELGGGNASTTSVDLVHDAGLVSRVGSGLVNMGQYTMYPVAFPLALSYAAGEKIIKALPDLWAWFQSFFPWLGARLKELWDRLAALMTAFARALALTLSILVDTLVDWILPWARWVLAKILWLLSWPVWLLGQVLYYVVFAPLALIVGTVYSVLHFLIFSVFLYGILLPSFAFGSLCFATAADIFMALLNALYHGITTVATHVYVLGKHVCEWAYMTALPVVWARFQSVCNHMFRVGGVVVHTSIALWNRIFQRV